MQASQPPNTENKNNILKDDESINFRPSPNFKHMKKYLKSKFEEEASNTSPINSTMETSVSQMSKVEKEKAKTVEVHPPLPPNPPPDSPIYIEFKKEIEDDDYNSNPEVSDSAQPEALKAEHKNGDADKPKKIMCRQFVRGTCTRGSSCIFVHELILSQLPGVYTFCKNFQNSVCTYQKCKFVHATVFEKEYFFRTGYLPQHALAHLKENTTLQPPPPPPLEGAQPPVQPIFTNPPPTLLTQSLPMSILTCTPNIENKNSDVGTSSNSFPLKRDWSGMDDLNSAPHEHSSNEPLAKKCKDCDVNEFRLQCSKNKLEKMLRSSEEFAKKLELLNKKTNTLYTVLWSLFKSNAPKGCPAPSGINPSLSIRPEKEKGILEQLNNLLTTSNRPTFPFATEDNSKSIPTNTNMNLALLAKLLLSSGEQTLSPDAS